MQALRGRCRAPPSGSMAQIPGPPAPFPGRHESFTKPHQTLGYQAEDRLPPGEPPSPRALPEPRAAGAGIQPARARAGRGQGHAAPGAPAVPLHRLVQHGRVLRDPRGGPEGAAEARRRRHRARRPHAARDLLARDGHRPRPHRAPVRDPQRGDPAGARRRRHPLPAPRRVDARPAGVGARLLHPRDDAGAHADRARPGAPVPARLQQEPQLRGGAGRARRLRPRFAGGHRAGPARAAARDPPAARRGRRRARLHLPHLHPARARGRALRRHERARLPPVPRDAQLRPLRRGGGGEGPPEGAAGGAAAAPPRRRRAPGGRRHDDRADVPRSCSSSSGWRPGTSTA